MPIKLCKEDLKTLEKFCKGLPEIGRITSTGIIVTRPISGFGRELKSKYKVYKDAQGKNLIDKVRYTMPIAVMIKPFEWMKMELEKLDDIAEDSIIIARDKYMAEYQRVQAILIQKVRDLKK